MNPLVSRKTLMMLIAINAFFYIWAGWSAQNPHDYRAFYFGGETIRKSPIQLYDVEYQRPAQRTEFGDKYFYPFFHPPHELLIFAPLSKLPYAVSLNLWRLLSVLFLIISGLLVARSLDTPPLHTMLLMAAVYPVSMCLLLGQDSLLLLVLVSCCFYMLRRNLDIAAGLVLAFALFKPQLPLIMALALFAVGRRAFFLSFLAFGSAITSSSIAMVGWDGVRQIMTSQKLAETGPGVAAMPTIRGLIAFAAGDYRWISITLLITSICIIFPIWQRTRCLEFAVGSSICLASLCPLYLYAYDLVVLTIPLVLIAQRGKRSDLPILAALTSTPLQIMLYYLNASALLALPTLALALSVGFRLHPEEMHGLGGSVERGESCDAASGGERRVVSAG